MAFPAVLRKLRNEHRFTQGELSKRLGISDRTIRMYEAGEIEPTLSILVALADCFDVSLDYLAGRSDNPKEGRTPR